MVFPICRQSDFFLLEPLSTITPTVTLLETPVGIAVASNGDIWVANFGGASVMKFTAGSSGNASVAVTLAGANTMINLPSYLALDAAGNLYVSNDGSGVSPPTSDAILIFASGSNGDVAPNAILSGSNTHLDLPTGLAFDHQHNLFAANYSNPANPTGPGPSLLKFKRGSSGNVFPSTKIADPNTHLSQPAGIFLAP
jgi:hypothetical protein